MAFIVVRICPFPIMGGEPGGICTPSSVHKEIQRSTSPELRLEAYWLQMSLIAAATVSISASRPWRSNQPGSILLRGCRPKSKSLCRFHVFASCLELARQGDVIDMCNRREYFAGLSRWLT